MCTEQIKYALPSAITLLRLAAAPLFYYVFLNCSCILAFIVFVLAALTDILDGFIARKFDATSNAGAYLDVTVDFILIFVVFMAFFQKIWYSSYISILILLPFIGFVLSSGIKRPIYDPVGKYMGTFLMVMITLTLLLPCPIVRKSLTAILALFCIISITSRSIFLRRRKEVGDE